MGQPSAPSVAVLGLGRMGSAVASRLLGSGLPVRVWNRSPEAIEPLVSEGAARAGTPGDAAAASDVVLVSVSDDAAVTSVLTGPDAPPPGPDGPLVVDCSTVSPATSRRLAGAFPGRFLAMPILGGPQAVGQDGATYLVAGPEPARRRVTPVVDRLSPRQVVCGDDPGAATTVKLVCNFLLLGGLAVLGEAVATAQAAGIDSGWLAEFLRGGPLVAGALHNRLPDVVSGDHEGWFAATMGEKDVRLLAETAEGSGVDAAVARTVERRFARAAELGWAGADVAAVVEAARGRTR